MAKKKLNANELAAVIRKRGARQRVFYFKDLEFWAERGLIHIIQRSDGEYNVCSIDSFKKRADMLRAGLPRLQYADERAKLQTMIENMTECIRQATGQGDPMHTKSRRQVAHDNRYISYVRPIDRGEGTIAGPSPSTVAAKKLLLPGDPGFK